MDHRYLAITPTIMCIAFAIAQRSEARVVKLIVEQRNSFVGGADWGNVGPHGFVRLDGGSTLVSSAMRPNPGGHLYSLNDQRDVHRIRRLPAVRDIVV